MKLAVVLINEFTSIRDSIRADINNSLVKYNLKTNYNFNFKDSKMLDYIHKNARKLLNLV